MSETVEIQVSVRVVTCFRCGEPALNPFGFLFCHHCGAKYSPLEVEVMSKQVRVEDTEPVTIGERV